MIWIGTMYLLIMLFGWLAQRRRAGFKTRLLVLLVSLCFFACAEVLFLLKERWNVPMFIQYVRESIQNWMFG
ncbi:MAG: hypothetical protein E7L01_14345 [Paenibacillus macerans]|uniref:Uncharacterized protein n=1 Tax=Paenibacillus macerans TaxID=44252 RepID=A0A090YC66_PAEMA|nr:hypothetical protein [Paenibacillus macerans]KFM95437.1 hypothetical protein DJ90_5507 [Paenibacillus macerans]MBS5912750.1 hypothetical protein [Paenibacillus macerans]MCY7562419.1 hypothetical protein [Paenibacillus macerans]MDU5950902.1 hypothetical protein [Paenibacillus macerans]MDU7474490.1 hypothetical protein [Paenibacillus macerans]